MKVVLEFDLPTEREEHEAALKGSAAIAAIQEFYNNSLRNRLKYQDLSDSDDKLLSEIKDELFQVLNEYDIEI